MTDSLLLPTSKSDVTHMISKLLEERLVAAFQKVDLLVVDRRTPVEMAIQVHSTVEVAQSFGPETGWVHSHYFVLQNLHGRAALVGKFTMENWDPVMDRKEMRCQLRLVVDVDGALNETVEAIIFKAFKMVDRQLL